MSLIIGAGVVGVGLNAGAGVVGRKLNAGAGGSMKDMAGLGGT